MNKMHFGQKVLETAIVQGVALVGLFGINIIVARTLGPAGKGALSLVTYVPSVLFAVSNFGLYFSNSYFWGRKNESIHKLVTNSVIFSIFISIITAILFIGLYPTFQHVFFEGIDPRLMFFALIAVPFLQVDTTFDNFLLMREKVRFYNWVSLLKIGLQIVLVIVLLVGLHRGIYAALAAWIFAQVFSIVLTAARVFIDEKIHYDFDLRLLFRTIVFGLKGYIGNMIYFLNKRLDLVLVAAFLSLHDVGIYSVALALGEVLFQLPTAVTSMLFPRVSVSTDEESNDFTPRIFRNTLLLMIIVGIVTVVVAAPFVSLFFGEQYNGAIVPLYIVVPGIVLVGATSVLGNDLAGRGKLVVHSTIAGCALVLNLVLNSILIPAFGLNGAAFGSTISFSLISIFTVMLFKAITKTRYRNLLLPRRGDFKYYGVFLQKFRALSEETKEGI